MVYPFRPKYKEDLHPRGIGGKWVAKPGGGPKAPSHKRPSAPEPAREARKVPGPSAPKGEGAKKPARGKGTRPRPMRYAEKAAEAKQRQAEAKKRVEQQQPESTQEKQVIDAARHDLRIGRRPDGTMDWEARAAYIDEKLTQLFKDKVETISMFRDPKTGEWDPLRRAKQEKLIRHIWDTQAAHIPNEGLGIFSGGLGGAGKGYALGKVEKIDDKTRFFTVNPDVIKEHMALPEFDMIPMDVDPNMTPMELSPVTHEEASMIADELAHMAYAERKNLVWDFTMGSVGSVVNKRLEPMREAGYGHIGALFVDTTVEQSVKSAQKRWRRGMEEYIDYEGEGGRFLPSGATKGNMPAEGSTFRSKNRETFEQVKHLFDGTVVYENLDGKSMNQVASSGKGLPR